MSFEVKKNLFEPFQPKSTTSLLQTVTVTLKESKKEGTFQPGGLKGQMEVIKLFGEKFWIVTCNELKGEGVHVGKMSEHSSPQDGNMLLMLQYWEADRDFNAEKIAN